MFRRSLDITAAPLGPRPKRFIFARDQPTISQSATPNGRWRLSNVITIAGDSETRLAVLPAIACY